MRASPVTVIVDRSDPGLHAMFLELSASQILRCTRVRRKNFVNTSTISQESRFLLHSALATMRCCTATHTQKSPLSTASSNQMGNAYSSSCILRERAIQSRIVVWNSERSFTNASGFHTWNESNTPLREHVVDASLASALSAC